MSAENRRADAQPYEASKRTTLGEDAAVPKIKFSAGELAVLRTGHVSSSHHKRSGGGGGSDGSASRELRWNDMEELGFGNDLSSLAELDGVVHAPAVAATQSEDERSRERQRQRAKKAHHKHKRSRRSEDGSGSGAGVDGDDEAEEAAEGERSTSVVPHASPAAAAAAAFKTMTLSQIRLENFRLNHGITISANDQIDLEDTSCESSEENDSDYETEHGNGAAVDEDDEFRVRRNADDDDDDPDPDADPAGDGGGSFDNLGAGLDGVGAAREIARRNRKRRKERRKGDGVSSDFGRLNHCFLCAWGKRTDDAINNEHMEKLWRIFHTNVGEVPMEYIALAMHGYYRTTIRPAGTTRGQNLPRWRSKHVLACITTHNKIPQVALDHDLDVLNTMQGFLERKIGVQPSSGSDDKPVREMMKELRETMAIKWRLYAMPMSRMNFHSDDRDIKLGANRQDFRGLKLAKTTSRAGAPLTAAAAATKKQLK